MARNILEPYYGSIVAIYPHYHPDKGNITLLYSRNDEVHHLDRSISRALRDYLGLWALDLGALIQLYALDGSERKSKKTRVAPLPICRGHTLIPFKVRKCVGRHDGAYAYLEYESIDPASVNIEKQGISLCCGGFRLYILSTKRHFLTMLGRASCAARLYQERSQRGILSGHGRAFCQPLEQEHPENRNRQIV